MSGPLVASIALWEIVEEIDLQFNTRVPKIKVYTIPAAELLDIGAAAETSGASPGARAELIGARWGFGGTETTIEFLAGAKFRWIGTPQTVDGDKTAARSRST